MYANPAFDEELRRGLSAVGPAQHRCEARVPEGTIRRRPPVSSPIGELSDETGVEPVLGKRRMRAGESPAQCGTVDRDVAAVAAGQSDGVGCEVSGVRRVRQASPKSYRCEREQHDPRTAPLVLSHASAL